MYPLHDDGVPLMVEPCPFECVDQKVYGYACPWLGHRTPRQHEAVADLYKALGEQITGTIGTVLTMEDIARASKAIFDSLEI